MSKKGLGKGLGALISQYSTENKEGYIDNAIPIKKIKPNKNQPRKEFSKKGMDELTLSIKEKGILQPIAVRALDDGNFELIAGEGRYRAALSLKLKNIPAYIISVSGDEEMMELALIENLQRVDLDPIEEAEAYALLKSKHNLTQKEISKHVGKSRSVIANSLRLLNLPTSIRKAVKDKKITAGHARALSSLSRSTQALALFEKISKLHLSVRQTEELVSSLSSTTKKKKASKKQPKKSPAISEVENNLIHTLGTKVKISLNTNKRGKIHIDFFSSDDLQRIIDIISKK